MFVPAAFTTCITLFYQTYFRSSSQSYSHLYLLRKLRATHSFIPGIKTAHKHCKNCNLDC